MKRWKFASSIAAGAVVVSVIVLFYSIPVNPCSIFPSQTSNDLMAPVSPNELYDSTELVVIGRIIDSTAKCEGSQIWTYMKVAVEDSAKNPQGINVLTGKAYGGRIGNYGVLLEDSPIFNKGDRAFLYLYKDKPSDTIYRISQYSGALALNDLPDETISAMDILKTFRLQFATSDNSSTIDLPQGESKEVSMNLESFFGYDSPTNVTISSFTSYNSSTSDSFNTINVTALNDFGLSVQPMHDMILPRPNGTVQTEFMISASNEAVPGVYDIVMSSEDDYSYLAGGVTNTYLRVNVIAVPEGNDGDGNTSAIVTISKGIDDIDSGVTFNPPVIRTILGVNGTVTWVNSNVTSIILESYDGYFNTTIMPDKSFSFTFNSTGNHEYCEKTAGKCGTVIVNTKEMEAKKLVPSAILTLSHEERANRIVTAIDPDDRLDTARLNNTRLVAFPTERGADIIVSKVPEYRGVEYRKYNGAVLSSFTDQEAMNFTKRFMEKIGYRMDGSEWVDAVNFGDVIDITIRQQVAGWIISDEGANFRYYRDHAWITIERWYDDVSSYEFVLGSEDSKPIAKEFMDSEVKRNPLFQKYAYQAHKVLHSSVEIIDDKVTYLVTIGYETTNPSYYEDRGHCGEPAYQGFDVMVDASTGTPFDWRFSMCE